MKLGIALLFLCLAACDAACRPGALIITPAPEPDASAAGDLCTKACGVVAEYCGAIGAAAYCIPACVDDQMQGVGAQLHPDCWAKSGSKGDIADCGDVACP